jgi:uncharacterized protein (TIGR03067 family)
MGDVAEYTGSVWTFTEKEFTITKGKAETKLAYALDPTTKPKQIDLLIDLRELNKKLKQEAIYKLEGDRLTICYFDFWNRPSDFGMPKGTAVSKRLVVLERQKK